MRHPCVLPAVVCVHAKNLTHICAAGAASNVDVFAVAEALAAVGPAAAEALRVEPVSPLEFLEEATALLVEAQQQTKALQETVVKAQVSGLTYCCWTRCCRNANKQQLSVGCCYGRHMSGIA
jgi:hypothetical protein